MERDQQNGIEYPDGTLPTNEAVSLNNTKCPETPEEINQFIADNVKLLHSLLKPYRGVDEYEDLFQEASLGFYRGIVTYSQRRALKPNGRHAKLTTYAYQCALNQVKMYLRAKQAKSRNAPVFSLDSGLAIDHPEYDSYLNRDLRKFDAWHPAQDDMEDHVYRREVLRRALRIVDIEMSREERIAIHRMLEGVSQVEIAKELNTSQANVSKCIKTAIWKIKIKLINRGIIPSDFKL